MKRVHLLEIHDQPWCPRPVRDGLTDFLQFALNLGNHYGVVAPRLRQALERAGARRVVDLCSGSGGPWLSLARVLAERQRYAVEVVLTDKYPNTQALERVRRASGGRIDFHPAPVDAGGVPPGLGGFRTLFTSFHHFPPDEARKILRDAVDTGQGIAVFEVTHRSVLAILLICLGFLGIFVLTPFVGPFRWSRLLWTYVVPLVPLVGVVDGIVSCLRTYTPQELAELAAQVSRDGYAWETGEVRGRWAPVPITYLIGVPGRGLDGARPAP